MNLQIGIDSFIANALDPRNRACDQTCGTVEEKEKEASLMFLLPVKLTRRKMSAMNGGLVGSGPRALRTNSWGIKYHSVADNGWPAVRILQN